MERLRVLVADDSALMRKKLREILSADPELEVAGVARDGEEAWELCQQLRPDVITLDVEMPRLDGLGLLRRLAEAGLTPRVVMVSSQTTNGARATVEALELGAFDFVAKPGGAISLRLEDVAAEIVTKVKAAGRSRVRRVPKPQPAGQVADPAPRAALGGQRASRVVAIGTSTGGPSALLEVVPRLPRDGRTGYLIVQHMPPGFTRSLAERLDQASPFPVREARDGDWVEADLALLAPGGWHMVVHVSRRIALTGGPPLHGVRPAVDPLFESVARVYGPASIGVLLTGMGRDGAEGMAALRAAGAFTIAQDEASCVVYGMPRAAVERGAACAVLPLDRIPERVAQLLQKREADQPA